jgi:hypothetical protein
MYDYEGSQAVAAVLLVKVGKVKIKNLEVENVKWRVQQGEQLSWVFLHSNTISNFVI